MSKKLKNIVKDEIKQDIEAVVKINKENIIDSKKDVVKQRLLKLYFEPLNTTDRIYDFLYNDKIRKSTNNDNKNYLIRIKSKLADALNLKKIEKDFEIAMYLNDGNTDPADKSGLPRAVKLKRLK